MDGVLPAGVSVAGSSSVAPLARPRRLTDAQMRVIRMSVARACTDAEFDHFIAVAERTGLDPLRRQISAIILGQHDPTKRAMIPLATIDGLRAIAARQGDYRPMETAPALDVDPDKKNPHTNPLGIVRAEVTVWRRFDANWYPITGEAWWDEYAPLVAERGDDGAAPPDGGGVRAPPDRAAKLATNWRRMGRVLICKCAEAQALRRGWPEDLSGLYGEEELHRAELEEILAHERAERASDLVRQRALAGSRRLLLMFGAGEPAITLDRDEVGERIAAFIATASSAAEIEAFQARNREALAAYWNWLPDQALDLKRQAERAIDRLKAEDAPETEPVEETSSEDDTHAEATSTIAGSDGGVTAVPRNTPRSGQRSRQRRDKRQAATLPQAADQGDQATPA